MSISIVMNFKTALLILVIGLVGWINNGQLVSNYKYAIISILILFSVRHFKKTLGTRLRIGLVIFTIFSLYNIICYNNSWINEDVKDLIIDINKKNISSIDDKTKVGYYNSVLENIYGIKDKYQNESLSMAIEIDRLINSGFLLSDRILNYFLYSQTSPFIPTSINLLPNHEQFLTHLIIYALITFIFINEIDSRKKLKYLFWVLIMSSTTLTVFGIAFKGNSNIENEFVAASTGIWSAPDSRISFATFSYKNHWSAYIILITSIVFLLFYSLVNKFNYSIIRDNKFTLLIAIFIIFILSIFYSNSNSGSALISFYIIGSLFIFFRKKLLKAKFLITLVFSLSLVSFSLLQTEFTNRFSELLVGNSFRLNLWNDIINQIEYKTFWGYGINSFKSINGIYQSIDITLARQQNLVGAHNLYIPLTLHAHSDFLQAISEIGFFGLCIVLFPVSFFVLRQLFTITIQSYKFISFGLLTIIIFSIIDFPFRNFAVCTIFLLLFTICESHAKFRSIK